MGKGASGRAQKARAELERLRASRRKDLIKMLAAIAAMMLVIWGKTALELNGTFETGNMAIGIAMLVTAFVLAIFAGSAGVSFAKNGRGIKDAQRRTGR
ncbi:MAG: hypothetical protein RSB04_00560 [Gordonibacter sp.]|uniref:hypothetical protein n=1 Tax=Gordonibacter sp. TaxID=1968902 RepID=UPI002FC6A16D